MTEEQEEKKRKERADKGISRGSYKEKHQKLGFEQGESSKIVKIVKGTTIIGSIGGVSGMIFKAAAGSQLAWLSYPVIGICSVSAGFVIGAVVMVRYVRKHSGDQD